MEEQDASVAVAARKRRWLRRTLIALAVLIVPPWLASWGWRHYLRGEIATLETVIRQARAGSGSGKIQPSSSRARATRGDRTFGASGE